MSRSISVALLAAALGLAACLPADASAHGAARRVHVDVVRVLPAGHHRFVHAGAHYGYHAGRFYTHRRDGWVVVRPPLGAVVPVTLPDGSSLKVRVPAGAQSGRTLSVRGKGLPGAGAGGAAGDLELVVQVVLPSAHDPRAHRHYEAMASELADFDARAQAAADRTRER